MSSHLSVKLTKELSKLYDSSPSDLRMNPLWEEQDKSSNIGKDIMQSILNNKGASLVSKQQFRGAQD